MFLLAASVAVLLVGPLTYGLAGHAARALKVLEFVVIVSVGALLLLHIVPEIFATMGWVAAVPLIIGMLGPSLVERLLAGLERQAHLALILLVLVGLAVHALLDGIALALPSAHEHGGAADPSLPIAVVLHRIPVSLLVWWLVRPRFGVVAASIVLGVEGCGAILGYFTAAAIAVHVHSPVIGALQALVAGSILHVLVDRHDYSMIDEHPHAH